MIKKLIDILKASHFFKPCWHTRVLFPHGDKHTIVDPMSVRIKVRKMREDSR